jgi:small-conductance mechanosensitive channel
MNSGAQVIAAPVFVAAAASFVLLAVRGVSTRFFRKWAGGAEGRLRIYKPVWQALAAPSIYWCIAAGLYFGMAISDLPEKYVFYTTRTIHVILVLSVSIGVANMVGGVFAAQVQKAGIPISTTGLASAVLKGAIIVVGCVVILGILGVSVAPLLTAMGVGGLAVALALQDTLANLFAGFHLLVEKSIRVGDYIRLESGQEGCVDDITWRTARVRTPANNMVVIPNKKLAQSVVVNYSLPQEEMGISLAVHVPYGADYDRIESLLVEEAIKAAAELPGLVEGQKPSVDFDFAESWVECSLNLSVRRFIDQAGVKSALRRRILRRLSIEGIETVFPTKTVYVKEARDGGTGASL